MIRTTICVMACVIAGFVGAAFADDYPDGCVSCHVEGETDMRLNVYLNKIGHGRGGERTKVIPTGCNRCHVSDGSGAVGSLRQLVHRVHYGLPDVNRFVKEFGGKCLNCHSMDTKTGVAGIKSGERNWALTFGDSQ